MVVSTCMLKIRSIGQAIQKLSTGYTDRQTDKGKTFTYPHTRTVKILNTTITALKIYGHSKVYPEQLKEKEQTSILRNNRNYRTLKPSLFFRDFRLILNPRKGLLHPLFKAYAIDGVGNEKVIHVGKNNLCKVKSIIQ